MKQVNKDIEKDVAIYSNVEAIPDGNLNRRLNVQVSSRNLRAKIRGLLADCAPGDLRWAWIGKERPILILRNLGGRGEQACENRESDQASVVAVHFIAESREAVSVLTDHPGKIEG